MILALFLAVCEIFLVNASSGLPFTPELLLIFTVFSGLYLGPVRGAEIGFLSGLLKGLIGIGPLGAAAASFCIIGLICGGLRRRFARETFLTQFLVSFASSAAFSFIVLGAANTRILYQALITGALSIPLFFVFNALFGPPRAVSQEAGP